MIQEYKNLTDIISFQAKENPKKIALILEDKNISFKELDTIIWKIAMYLNKQDIPKNSIIAHIFKNQFYIIITMLATARIGLTVFSIPQNNSSKQKKDLLDKLNINYIVSDFQEDLGINDILINLKDILKNIKKINYSIKDSNPKAPWLIVTGSGSTGNIKFMPYSHKNQIERSKIHFKEYFGISENIRISSLVHFDYLGAKMRLLQNFYNKSTYFLFEDKDFLNIINFCIKYKITILYLTAFHLEKIISICKQLNIKKPFVEFCRLSSSTISERLRKEALDFVCNNILIQYATNESPDISGILQNKNTLIDESIGFTYNNINLQIVDKNDKEIPIGEIGLIRVRSSGTIDGYLNDEEATKKAFRNGWFYPGDLGKFTKDKKLIYYGRSDYMMIMNGINIYPAQIENTITLHEAVKDAVAIPIKHPVHQDIPICAIEVKKNQKISKEELLSYCIERLGFASPKEIILLDFIPRNIQGKVMRSELNKIISQKLGIKKEEHLLKENLKQPTKEYKVEITIPKDISIELINIWFKDVLNLKEITISSNNHFLEEVCNKTLVLIQTLFEISQIPIFYHGKIKHINLNNNKYNVILDIGYIDLIPNEFYIKVINFSFKYILWMGQFEPNIENKYYFYRICQEEIINPIQKNMPPGKSRIPVLKTAFNRNIPFIHLGNGVYQLGWGNKSRKMDRSTIDTDSAMGSNLSQNKIFTANLLKMAALPAPIHGVAQTKEEALEIALQLKYPVVIKPIDLDRGEGVTVDIYDENRLFKAFELAFNLSKSKRVIVEKQVLGVCHRLFIANNKLLYCVKRLAISVQADGINNISTLIDNANNLESNKAPWIKKEFYPKDTLTIEALKKVGFTLDSIPLKNTWIELRDIESTQWGGRDEDVTTIVHPDNLDIALRASKLFGLSVAGIDIITNDISKSWSESNAIINEVNFAPLLGGGEISRSCIPKFFDDFIEKNGRIPLEIFIGNTQETINIAKAKQEEYLNAGYKCYLTTHNTTLDNNLKQIILPTNNISNRTQALLLNDNVEALILLIQNNEFLYTPIPFDKASKITIISKELKNIHSNKNIDKIEFDNLIYNISM